MNRADGGPGDQPGIPPEPASGRPEVQPSGRRVARIAGWVLAAGVAGLAGWFLPQLLAPTGAPQQPVAANPASESARPVGAAERDAAARAGIGHGDYRLVTDKGEAFTAQTLSGKPTAVFFGYTHCPDVCPTTLGDISIWQDALGERAQGLRIYFVTVDPERDTAPVLAEYLSWAEGITGVTGAPDQIAAALQSFAVFARRVDDEAGDYTMDHTAFVMLFDRQGRFVDTIGYQEPEATALPKLERLLSP